MQGDSALGRALVLVRDLRARCPWDRAQTRATLAPYLIEEALELDHALRDVEPPPALRDELGDLLLHLAFQIVIGEERAEFDAESVTRALEEKMHHRHPHLYGLGDKPASWERAKRELEPERTNTLGGLPPALPPLLRAYRLQERAAGIGFDWPDATGPLAKVKEETAELERAVEAGDAAAQADELGDLLFTVVNLARKLGVDPRSALDAANAKFTRRFGDLEALAKTRGIDVGRAGLDALDRLWDEVKP
ncbi:MAG TPA: nucleoside triphosphate pyrophosphohydrolase [Gemmatimonadales bacterium]|nr:nucleoside triphosphate pyrophosphohydrolase [Gemmatimonadales bacterium]